MCPYFCSKNMPHKIEGDKFGGLNLKLGNRNNTSFVWGCVGGWVDVKYFLKF